MKTRTWIPFALVLLLSACTYTDGQCWLRSDDNGGTGAGGGVIVPPYGGGDNGNVPPTPQGAGDSTPPDCVGVGTYSSSLFKFTTTLADDGTDVGGGYQEATASNVKFVDGRQDPPAAWTCKVWVGMPIRTAKHGTISPEKAAEMAADVLTTTATPTMHSRDTWIPALFCSQLGPNMVKVFGSLYKGLGASAKAQ